MNLNALLDVTAQRAPTPLDRSVSDDGGDAAFADVMSQYGPDCGGKSPTELGAQTTAAADVSAEAGTPVADARSVALEAQIVELEGGANGEALPPVGPASGQTLPPAAALVDLATLDAHPAPQPGDDDQSDSTNAALDPMAAAVLAALAAPVPVVASPPVAPTSATGTAAATVPTVPIVAQGTAAETSDAATVALPTTVDDADSAQLDPTAFERIRAQLDRLQRPTDANPTSEPRRNAVAASTGTTPPTPLDGAVVQTLRTLGRARDDSPQPLPNVRARDVRAIDPAIAGSTKPVATQLATAVDAIARKDQTVESDAPDAPTRIDATQARIGGTDTARDAQPSRLGDAAQQHAQRFAGELADRVLVMRNQRLDGATVTLEPRELGRIDIQVRVQADTTHVSFTAQHAAVRDALEGQLPRLRSMLEEAGLSLGAVDVGHAGARNASGGDGGGSRSYDATRATATVDADAVDSSTPWRPRASSSLIDLHA
jgi:flagellar hook-length control protein FliK